MNRRLLLRLAAVTSIAAAFDFSCCTVLPPLHRDQATTVMTDILSTHTCPMTAYGEVKLSLNGESFRCGIDLSNKGPGELTADLSGPFGISLASLHASDGIGFISFGGKKRYFDSTTTLEELLQFSGNGRGRFTVTEIETLMQGMVPASWGDPLRRRPDTTIDECRTISALWKTDSIQLHAQIRKKPPMVESLELLFNSGEQITMGSIENGRARRIEVRENDGNSIQLNYSHMKCKQQADSSDMKGKEQSD